MLDDGQAAVSAHVHHQPAERGAARDGGEAHHVDGALDLGGHRRAHHDGRRGEGVVEGGEEVGRVVGLGQTGIGRVDGGVGRQVADDQSGRSGRRRHLERHHPVVDQHHGCGGRTGGPLGHVGERTVDRRRGGGRRDEGELVEVELVDAAVAPHLLRGRGQLCGGPPLGRRDATVTQPVGSREGGCSCGGERAQDGTSGCLAGARGPGRRATTITRHEGPSGPRCPAMLPAATTGPQRTAGQAHFAQCVSVVRATTHGRVAGVRLERQDVAQHAVAVGALGQDPGELDRSRRPLATDAWPTKRSSAAFRAALVGRRGHPHLELLTDDAGHLGS